MPEEIFSNGKKRIIKQESENSYLIEGESIYLKWSMSDPPSSVEFHDGPRLIVGKNFFNKGTISSLEPVGVGVGNKVVRVKIGTPPTKPLENLDFIEGRFSRKF